MKLDEAIRIVDPATRREALYIYNPEDRQAVENEARHMVVNALQEKNNGGWVSVEDRLPENGTPVLICNKQWDYSVVANYAGCGVWINTWEQRMTFTPTHWQPLPEAPKGEKA